MPVLGRHPRELQNAVDALGRGEIVAFPTETFYGLAAIALDVAAVDRLAAFKGRTVGKAIPVIVDGPGMLDRLCVDVSPTARALIAAHWPGPLTLALPARVGVPALLVSDGCVAVRQSSHPVAQALVQALGQPITATSANRSGGDPPTSAAQVAKIFASGCVILDGPDTPGGSPSTVARVVGSSVEVLRAGALHLPSTRTRSMELPMKKERDR